MLRCVPSCSGAVEDGSEDCVSDFEGLVVGAVGVVEAAGGWLG